MLERVKGDGISRWGYTQSHHKTKDKALRLSDPQFLICTLAFGLKCSLNKYSFNAMG
jgi:hypothetical protein